MTVQYDFTIKVKENLYYFFFLDITVMLKLLD